ncbi:hypothetical protein ACIQF6_28880 [Kitasatospora sp. NPDC092948]|uniref:hypothetical protein n=1 Tax=Kitasatospora sp. NPDC092948 TaxID=3364088 RepID=UPI0038163068
MPLRRIRIDRDEHGLPPLYVSVLELVARRDPNFFGGHYHGLIVVFGISLRAEGDPEADGRLQADRLAGEVGWRVGAGLGPWDRTEGVRRIATALEALADSVALQRALIDTAAPTQPLQLACCARGDHPAPGPASALAAGGLS